MYKSSSRKKDLYRSDVGSGFSNGTIKIIIADRQPVTLFGLAKLIEGMSDISVRALADSVGGLYRALDQMECDVLICDYVFDDREHPDGLQLIQKISRDYPNVRTIYTSSRNPLPLIRRAIDLGIDAFLRKEGRELFNLPSIIRTVHQGRKYFDSVVAGLILQGAGQRGSRQSDLSPRELEVVRMWSRGMSVNQISALMQKSKKTISTQKTSAMRKLGVTTSAELLRAVEQML